ncbi:MAG: hypothetical protein EOS63_18920, partial [Mesorhizobium sp.]
MWVDLALRGLTVKRCCPSDPVSTLERHEIAFKGRPNILGWRQCPVTEPIAADESLGRDGTPLGENDMKGQPRILAGTAIGLLMASAPLGAYPLQGGVASGSLQGAPLIL